jgi:6,7-dimethyl-8-ribityllumazine synthase
MNNMNIKNVEGNYDGKNQKIAIVVSRFNELVTSKLLSGCIDSLTRHQVNEKDISIYWTSGAFEVAATANKILKTNNNIDGVICLSAIIRGETPHFDYVAAEITKGIAQISLENGKPVIYGVITADSVDQALDRAGIKTGNKGFDAGMTAIEQINLYKNI